MSKVTQYYVISLSYQSLLPWKKVVICLLISLFLVVIMLYPCLWSFFFFVRSCPYMCFLSSFQNIIFSNLSWNPLWKLYVCLMELAGVIYKATFKTSQLDSWSTILPSESSIWSWYTSTCRRQNKILTFSSVHRF